MGDRSRDPEVNLGGGLRHASGETASDSTDPVPSEGDPSTSPDTECQGGTGVSSAACASTVKKGRKLTVPPHSHADNAISTIKITRGRGDGIRLFASTPSMSSVHERCVWVAEQVGDLTTVTFEYHYSYPAHEVWTILISPQLFGQWIRTLKQKIRDRSYLSFSVFPFMGSGFVGEIDGSFTRVVADELLAYRLTTRDGSIAIDSRWTLNPDPGGTLLLVDAAGFKPDDQDQMRFRQLCLVGWPTVLQLIDELLHER